jgi:predicted helicase
VSNRTKERGYVFALFLYASQDEELFDSGKKRIENIEAGFRKWLDRRYDRRFSANVVLNYIYGVLHSATYRKKYAEFLHVAFPRIPFPKKASAFEELAELGGELLEAHLMRKVKSFGAAKYLGKGTNRISNIGYDELEKAVHINDTQRFAPVPASIWQYHLGGYQVIERYLKSRKERILSLEEIENVTKMANVISFTIEQIGRINTAYRKSF